MIYKFLKRGMNRALQQLSEMYSKTSRLIIGLMSGTSLDGLDIALCRITGSGADTQAGLEHYETFGYSDDFKSDIRSIFSKQQADLQKVTLLNAVTANLHAEMILNALKKWNVKPSEVDCIASHGQTIYHSPKRLHGLSGYPDATLQIGDGDHIAVKTGIITISDFRQKHIAAGGEGAPLALYGDHILFSSKEENRVMLNIGGISNFTFLPMGGAAGTVCSDTGPGNTLTDALSKKYFNAPFDKDGGYAGKGRVIEPLLETMLLHPFFKESLPKTTGPELFNLQFIEDCRNAAGIDEVNPEDLVTTASLLTARSIAMGIKRALTVDSYSIYVSGGGCHNSFLMEKLRELFPNNKVKLTGELGFNPDAKEAILFALLANETICGSSLQTGGGPAVTMGKISLPT